MLTPLLKCFKILNKCKLSSHSWRISLSSKKFWPEKLENTEKLKTFQFFFLERTFRWQWNSTVEIRVKKVDDPSSIVIHIFVTIRRGFDFSRIWISKLGQEFRSEKQVRQPDISYKVFYVASKYKCWFSFVLITAVVVVCIAVVALHTRSCGKYRAVGRANAGMEDNCPPPIFRHFSKTWSIERTFISTSPPPIFLDLPTDLNCTTQAGRRKAQGS